MKTIYFITHPEVVIDPKVEIDEWHLSETGIERTKRLSEYDFWPTVQHIFTSTENKAIETGKILSEKLDIPVRTFPNLHENDRSATGYLPQKEFDEAVYQFFSRPRESFEGWERAIDAQERIVSAIDLLADQYPDLETIAIVGHGGTGTLLRCEFGGLPIDRMHCQKQVGALMQFDLEHRSVVSDDWEYF